MTDKDINEILIENRRMRIALRFINKWKIPDVESKGEMVPYVVAMGSNGARDYMRIVAGNALVEADSIKEL